MGSTHQTTSFAGSTSCFWSSSPSNWCSGCFSVMMSAMIRCDSLSTSVTRSLPGLPNFALISIGPKNRDSANSPAFETAFMAASSNLDRTASLNGILLWSDFMVIVDCDFGLLHLS